MKNPFTKSGTKSSRQQIQIKEVIDDILVLPHGEYRQIVETSSINFELKSEAEQDVMIDSFQNFLNALPCPLQIVVRVREVDIDRYLEDMGKTKVKETQGVYKKQIDSYCQFVKKLVSGNKILSRHFYLIVPFKTSESHPDLKLIKDHLTLEREIIIKGLERMQMKARTLTGLEILNLFYSVYNAESLKTQALTKEAIDTLLKNTYV